MEDNVADNVLKTCISILRDFPFLKGQICLFLKHLSMVFHSPRTALQGWGSESLVGVGLSEITTTTKIGWILIWHSIYITNRDLLVKKKQQFSFNFSSCCWKRNYKKLDSLHHWLPGSSGTSCEREVTDCAERVDNVVLWNKMRWLVSKGHRYPIGYTLVESTLFPRWT